MKRILSAILVAVMMLTIAPVTNIFIDTDTTITASAATSYYKVVNTGSSGLRLRKGPGSNYATILIMPNGAKVKYLNSKSNGFYKVSYTKSSKTYTGWCSSSYLKKISSTSISSADKIYLGEIFSALYGNNYNSSSSSANELAYATMFNLEYGSVFSIYDYYGWSYTTHQQDVDSKFKTKDPKNYVNKCNAAFYCKLSASKVDWILKNVYNVQPNHSRILKNDGIVSVYYYNGYYYYLGYYLGAGFTNYTISSYSLSNSYYILKGKAYDTESKLGTFIAKVKLKTVDGKKVWSLYTYTFKSV